MIDIPVGKALIAVEREILAHCGNCDLFEYCDDVVCCSDERQDGKNVYFKLIPYKEGVK